MRRDAQTIARAYADLAIEYGNYTRRVDDPPTWTSTITGTVHDVIPEVVHDSRCPGEDPADLDKQACVWQCSTCMHVVEIGEREFPPENEVTVWAELEMTAGR